MGFDSVYASLKELFPQVDARLLKAVAIEHSKDPDVAVEAVLTEVLPFIDEKSNVPTSAAKNKGKMVETFSASSSVVGSSVGEEANASGLLTGDHSVDDDSSFYDAKDTHDQLTGNIRTEESMLSKRCEDTNTREVISSERCEKISIEAGQVEKLSVPSVSFIGECSNVNYIQASGDHDDKDNCNQGFANHEVAISVPSHEHEDKRADMHVNNAGDVSSSCRSVEDSEADARQNVLQEFSNSVPLCNLNLAPHFDFFKEQPSSNCYLFDYKVSEALKNLSPDALGSNAHHPSDANNKEMNTFVDADFVHEFPASDAVVADGEANLSTIITHSGQICRVSLLEDIIKEAKNYKDSMLSAVESVVRLMEDVELQEKEAEHAIAAAARGGVDILEKVEEIKKILKHAKEANEMHAGEVFGEKSILATEVRELQTRLLGLSDEKEKSISMLDEMRKGLEERLAVAEARRRVAEQEMLEKQMTARGALADQEHIMDKVVEESRLLQQEAEENSKLRDFLMEKGGVVDALQGEISVICQDVKSLKENLDNRVSLSKSLSIEKTSCRLASSNSSVRSVASIKSLTSLKRTDSLKSTASVKSTASDPAIEHVEYPYSPARMSRATSLGCQTPRSNIGEEPIRFEVTTGKPLLDEDWEICDMN